MIEWRDIAIDPRYEISDDGQVRRKAYLLKPWRLPSGHLSVSLGARKRAYIHRLVADAFLGGAGEVTHHKNDDPSSNGKKNLEPTTRSRNTKIAHRRGRAYVPPTKPVRSDDGSCYQSAQFAAIIFDTTPGAIRAAIRNKGVCRGFRWFYL